MRQIYVEDISSFTEENFSFNIQQNKLAEEKIHGRGFVKLIEIR